MSSVEADTAAPPDEWLTRDQFAARLQLPKSTVAGWVVTGDGPRYAKFGRHVRYRLSDVIAWENKQFGGDAS